MQIHTLSGCNPLRGSFILRGTLMKQPLKLLFISFKGVILFGTSILKSKDLGKASLKATHG